VRLDEWQRYIDSEFVDPGSAGKQVKSGAGLIAGPAEEADGAGHGAEIATSGSALEANGANGESETQADVGPPSSGPSQDAIAEAPSTVSASELLDTPGDSACTPTDTKQQPNPPSNRPKTVSTVEVEIPPFADYISKRRTASDLPAPQDYVPEFTPAQNEAQSVGSERTIDLTNRAETGAAPAPGATYPLTAPSIILEQLRASTGSGSSATDVALAQRRAGLLQRLLDPVLSVDETALLLGVPVPALRQYVERGVLRACEVPRDSGRASRANQETRARHFRLSDITRFAASRESAGELDSLFAQPSGPDQAS
jgi:hypothetical protein